MSDSIFGYFDDPQQARPAYDPGRDALCPVCVRTLGDDPVTTISLMKLGDDRSYFYRAHKACYASATPDDIETIESSLIDA